MVKLVELLIVKFVEKIKSDKSREKEKYSSLLNSLSNSLFMLSIIKKDEYCDNYYDLLIRMRKVATIIK